MQVNLHECDVSIQALNVLDCFLHTGSGSGLI